MEEIKDLLKSAADRMKNRTLNELLKNDPEYQNMEEEARQAYQAYEKLELEERQKEVVEILMARESERESDCMIHAYMAGILDAYGIFRMFDLMRE